MDGDLTLTGNLSVIQQNNETIINTTVNDYTLIVSEDISLNGDLKVSGGSTLNGELYVNNTISVSGDILPTNHLVYDIGSAQKSFRDIYMSNGTMYNVDSDGNANSMSTDKGILTVTYTDNTDPENSITTKHIQLGSINNKTGIGGLASVDASFTLDISGNLRVTQDVSLNSTLHVGKASTLSSTLDVTGASTMGSTLKVNDTLTVSKASTLSSTLEVAKASTLKSTLKVSKAATLSSTLAVSGATTMGSTLKVNDTLTVSKASILSSTLTVTGDVSFNSGLTVNGNLYATYPDTSIPSSAISGGVLTIQHTSDTGDTELVDDVMNVKTLQFDKDSGFDVSLQSVGVAKIRMNSIFKYWEVNGVAGLTAEGLDTVNLVSADGITLSANNNTDPKSLTIGYDGTATQNAISSKVDLSTDQSVGGHKTFTSDTSFNQDVDVTGKLSHNGLAITSGNEIDQIKTISSSLTLTSDTWTDTTISGTDLASGIYMFSVGVNDSVDAGGTHSNETYTGTLSWYSGTTNSDKSDEIQLHRSGENPGSGTIYLRTTRTPSEGTLKLQIYSDKSITNYSYEFKFRRFM